MWYKEKVDLVKLEAAVKWAKWISNNWKEYVANLDEALKICFGDIK